MSAAAPPARRLPIAAGLAFFCIFFLGLNTIEIGGLTAVLHEPGGGVFATGWLAAAGLLIVKGVATIVMAILVWQGRPGIRPAYVLFTAVALAMAWLFAPAGATPVLVALHTLSVLLLYLPGAALHFRNVRA